MEIQPDWQRVAGIHLEEDGRCGAVFLALDRLSSVCHLYDAALFNSEVLAVIAAGITARGRWIPLAWRKQDEDLALKLREQGVNVLPDPCADKQGTAEIISREIWQKLRASQLRVERRVGEWLNEYRSFYRDENKVPMKGFPLMAATRHAIEMLPYGRPESFGQAKKPCAPKVAIF